MGIPIQNSELSEKEKSLRCQIEKLTGAEVYLDRDVFKHEQFFAFLVEPLLADAEYVVTPEDRKLIYILDNPLEGNMPESQYAQYPDAIQQQFQFNAEHEPWLRESDNLVSSFRDGDNIETMLHEMLEYTKLLELGWHLGREEDFCDPFIPEPKPITEAEQIWDEYKDEQKALSNKEEEDIIL